ncbi:RBBP8 N-terminal-like protein isoform X2 [Labrus mixtus]|uniref:RBBP8 N-terminal-like protein isoform X2 n=1 Tax=Labrus mixtus TaxID=508554 RepID=UPI0029C0FD09|nr:RBBP8 N-terminal-like protein isoform X2 [Labrus mixtus]
MECFNSLLLKLKEVHEREVEGWQIKIQEMSSKKGCDTKRMEELFTKNQQMKEQQRLLTDNIKTLENRLRAGLCDRCTVTQEVAKRRQLEFESAQMQSLQHIALLAAEMNNLKKDNKSLREEIRSLRADRGQNDLTSSSYTEVKPGSSPNLSPSSAHVTLVRSRSSSQPAGGDLSVKTEMEQRAEETEVRLWRGNNRNTFDSYRPLTSLTWRSDQQSVRRAGERRPQSVEAAEQRPPLPPQTLPHKNSSSSSSSGGDVTPSRHAVHPSVPCRPQPIRSSPVSLPWPLSESSDWVGGPGSGLVFPSSVKSPPLRFPNLIQSIQQGRKQVLQSNLKLPKEPTVLFRLRSLPEIHPKTQEEKKEPPSPRAEGGSADGLREVLEGPLDLSERGRSRSNESSSDNSERARCSPDLKPDPAAAAPPPSSSSCPSPDQQQDQDPPTDHIHLEATEHSEEEKKVPVLTLSLRPVVLENLNSALHKQESSSHSKSSSPAAETGSSCDGQDEEESNQRCRRKRRCEETQTDRDSETEDNRPERKIQITVRTEENSAS